MLSDRRQRVLAALIEEYVARALPVGSRTLTERYQLSPRERDVLVGLAQGHTAAAIAESLHLSTSTAQGYIKSLYVKLGVNKKQQVIDLFKS